MEKYPISDYEEKEINKIISKLKEVEKVKKLNQLEKAYYIYHELCKIYHENMEYIITDVDTQYEKKENIYNKETEEDGKAVCNNMSITYAEALNRIGIEADIIRESNNKNFSLSHLDVIFTTDGRETYFANIIADLYRVQTGMRVIDFGTSEDRLHNRFQKDGRLSYLKRIKEKYGNLFEVTTKQKEDFDKKFGFNNKRMYTEDVLKMISSELNDKQKVSHYFKTTQRDEQIEKIIDFIINKVKIANVKGNKTLGIREAIKYYNRIQNYIFSKEEQNKYIKVYQGYREEENKTIMEVVLVILKENSNTYYRYSEDEGKFIKQKNPEEIKNLNIKYKGGERYKLQEFSNTIDNLEKRFTKNKDER